MKKLIFILGGQASGKMTVGEELAKITGLKLFHNHMTVELASHFYGFGTDLSPELKVKNKELFADMRDGIRYLVFENIAKSYLEGIIFTAVMYFDSEDDWELTRKYIKSFKDAAIKAGEETELYVVELVCDINERQRRNITENRLEKKPSKRNIEWTKSDIETTATKHRLVSNEEDIKRFHTKNYFKIDNTDLTAIDTAKQIKEKFGL